MIKGLKNKNLLLFLIILLAFILRVYWLDRADMQGDETTYSFRAIGYLDYLGSEQQTTPIQWFGNVPWWSRLSFHDAPPLVFIIQHLFFKFLGVSTFTARLPFALFGTATVYLIYLVTKKLFNKESVALLAGLLLAVTNYHVWASRVGYLEGILIFFIVLSIYFFLKLQEKPVILNYCLIGLTLGLAYLCKYTMVFLLPAFFVYLLIFDRRILFNKKALLTILTFLIVISPVIIYNIMVYQTRGHLDLQFTQLFGMDLSKDWSLFTKGTGERNLQQNLISVFQTLNIALGKIYFYLFIWSMLLLIINLYPKKNWENFKKSYLIVFLLLFLIIQFTFIGAGPRFLPLFTPLVAINLAWLFYEIHQKLSGKILKNILISLLGILIIYSTFEAVNTHWLRSARAPYNSELRRENYGFRQLGGYLTKQLLNKSAIDINKMLIVYDGRLNWFSRTWYFFRQVNYFNQHYVSIEYFINKINQEGEDYFQRVKGYQNYYFIKAENTSLDTTIQSNGGQMFKEFLVKDYNLKPVLIYRDDGQVAFEVYNFR